jgi:hypothetical protein
MYDFPEPGSPRTRWQPYSVPSASVRLIATQPPSTTRLMNPTGESFIATRAASFKT